MLQQLLQTPGSSYKISRTTDLPTVNITSLPAIQSMNGARLYYYEQLGLNNFQIMQGKIRALGLDQLMLPSHLAQAGIDWTGNLKVSDSYVGYRSVGNDVNAIVRTRRTITATGYGLEQLTLEIATEAGAGIRILSRGHIVWSFSNEQFLVVAEQLNGDGYQEVTLRPSSPDYQINVIDGQSVDFPTGFPIGQRGVNEYGQGNEACNQTYNEYYVQPSIFKSFQLTRKTFTKTLFKEDLQNNPAGGKFNEFYISLYGVQMPGAAADTRSGFSIGVFMESFGAQEFIRNMSQIGADMLLSKEHLGEDGVMQGNGLVESISPNNWYGYRSSSELNTRLWRFVLNNNYALKTRGYGNSPENPLTALCGSMAFDAIMNNLNSDHQVQYREDPYKSANPMANQDYLSAPRVYSQLTTVLGNWVRFVKFTPLDGQYYTAQRHPENQNLGIHSGDIIVIPQGSTQEAVEINDPSIPKAPGTELINVYAAKDVNGTPDFIKTQIVESGLRADGSTADGIVTRFGNQVEFKTLATYGIEVADPLAPLYITMR